MNKKLLFVGADPVIFQGLRRIMCSMHQLLPKPSRKRAEDELQQQLIVNKTITDNTASCLFMMDKQGHATFMNPAAEKVTGYTLDEIRGMPLHDAIHHMYPDGRPYPMSECPIDNAQADLVKMIDYEDIFVRKDGSLFPVICYIEPLEKDGEVIGSVLEFQDITERKQAEDALRKAHDTLEQRVRERTAELERSNRDKELILNSAGEGIYGLDLNGHTTFINPAAAKMIGYEPEEIIGKSQHDIIHHSKPDGSPYFKEECPICSAFRDGKVYLVTDEVFWRKDGTSFPVEYTSTPIMEEGKIIGAVVTFKDITEKKLIQTQLNHSQKMESIGQLAAGIAHEINTPMQFVGDNTHFLEDSFKQIFGVIKDYDRLLTQSKNGTISNKIVDEVEASLQDNDIDYLAEEVPLAIKQSLDGVDRVSKIIKAMKEFSHPGSEEKIPTDINKAIETTLTVARNEWKYVAEVKTDFDPNLPLVPCFVNDFNQIILNTIVNATHAIGDVVGNSGNLGTITLSTRQDDDWVEIRIRDTGTGIPEDIKAKVFDPFFTTKEVGKGTGQGLSIVHTVVVKKHQGTVSLETEQGKGTTFIFRFPLLSQQPSKV